MSKFLTNSVKVCNQFIWGNLSCTFIVDSKTHTQWHDDVEDAIANLKYGSIGVNCWSAVSYALFSTTWGGYPDGTAQSGVGVINNGYFFDYPEKSIVRAPFRMPTKPIWFYDNKNLIQIGKNFVKFEYSQSFFDFVKFVTSALALNL